jgi:hypothetical protein
MTVTQKTRLAMDVYRDIGARWSKLCSIGKAISITLSKCVCGLNYPACNVHVPYCTIVFVLCGSNMFLHIIC